MSNYATIQGETIPMAAKEGSGTGLAGSGSFESGETVLFTVLWEHNSSADISGITRRDWPTDFSTVDLDYKETLESSSLSPAEIETIINEDVQRYALHRMSTSDWDEFSKYYDTGGYNCIRYMGE